MRMVLSENAIFAAQIFPMSDQARVTTYLVKVEVVRGTGGKDAPATVQMRGFGTKQQALAWLTDYVKHIEPTADNDQ
jgi:hypothetical protein